MTDHVTARFISGTHQAAKALLAEAEELQEQAGPANGPIPVPVLAISSFKDIEQFFLSAVQDRLVGELIDMGFI